MPNQQVQFRWNKASTEDYAASTQSLRMMSPLPDVSTSLRLKGNLPLEALDSILAIAAEHEIEIGLILTATWPKGSEASQLRLWPRPVPSALEAAEHILEELENDHGKFDAGE